MAASHIEPMGRRARRWRPSRDRERLGPAVWIAGTMLATAVFLVLGVLYYWID